MLLRIAAALSMINLSAQDRPILDKEAALGAMLAQDFRKEATSLDSPAFDTYIERVGSKLSTQLAPSHIKYTFELMADDALGRNPQHKAAAFPGGYIFVPASLVLKAADEADFVRRIAHALAVTAVWRRPRDGQRATAPVIYMGGEFGLSEPDGTAADELTAMTMSRYTPTSQDEFLNMREEVRRLVADRAPRPPSLRNPR